MRHSLKIGVIALAVVAVSLVAWRPWESARERWLRAATRQLRQLPPPPASLASSLGSAEWAGQGYMLFTNGWACFTSQTFHSSMQVGDIGLLRSSDGSFYTCHFHFCVGMEGEYGQVSWAPEVKRPRPRDIKHFIELYGETQGCKRIPDG
jgi:hypothetical protein